MLNYKLATSATPVISFIEGIVMGGGVGLSIPGQYVAATLCLCSGGITSNWYSLCIRCSASARWAARDLVPATVVAVPFIRHACGCCPVSYTHLTLPTIYSV